MEEVQYSRDFQMSKAIFTKMMEDPTGGHDEWPGNLRLGACHSPSFDRAISPAWQHSPRPPYLAGRGGFGVDYKIRLLRGEAKASFLMDHGRVGPPGLLGGSPGAVNEIAVSQAGVVSSPPHLSKGEGYVLAPGDWIAVKTPGGGGYGPAAERDPRRWNARGYYTDVEAVRLFSSTSAADAE